MVKAAITTLVLPLKLLENGYVIDIAKNSYKNSLVDYICHIRML